MATLNKKHLRGTIGPVTIRKQGNNSIVQSKKTSHKIAPGTKVYSDTFGNFSKFAASIRQAFFAHDLDYYDPNAHSRLNQHLSWLNRSAPLSSNGKPDLREGNLARLVGYQFNLASILHDYIGFEPEIILNKKQELSFKLPANCSNRQIKSPDKKCTFLMLEIQAAVFYDGLLNHQSLGTQMIPINLWEDLQVQDIFKAYKFEKPAPEEGMILVVMSAWFMDRPGTFSSYYNKKEWHPCGIIAGFRY